MIIVCSLTPQKRPYTILYCCWCGYGCGCRCCYCHPNDPEWSANKMQILLIPRAEPISQFTRSRRWPRNTEFSAKSVATAQFRERWQF